MALTLTEAAKLSNNQMLQGVLLTIINEDPAFWGLLPWEPVAGNAIVYNRENAAPAVAHFAVGDTWAEATPTFTQVTSTLAIAGGDADVDQYVARTRNNINDIEAEVLALKVKALAQEIGNQFYYGTAASNEPTGLHSIVNTIGSGQQVHQGAAATGAALSLANLDLMVDLCRGEISCLAMPRNIRRRMSQFARANGSPVVYRPTEFGQRVMLWDGVPIVASDYLVMTETIASATFTAKTGGATGSIFALHMDSADGVMAMFGGDPTEPDIPIIVEEVGKLETKDAIRRRVKAYYTPAVKGVKSIARIDGITDVACVA